MFEQAGVIAVRGFGDLIEATALLATQPVPAGPTIAIVSNIGSAGELAAAACTELGLTVYEPHGLTRRRLRALGSGPGGGTISDTGAVDTTATVSGEDFRACLELLAADEDVHAVIALVLPTGATGDLVTAIGAADVAVPLVAVVLNQRESVRLLARPEGHRAGRIPAYGYPEAAVAAVARAVGYGAWRAEPRGRVPDFPDIRATDARTLAREFLRHAPQGGWLPPDKTAELLSCYGIAVGAAAPDGTEVIVTVAADQTFGPLVVFGLGGVATEVFADRAARLTPVTDTDADKLIRSIRSAPLLLGQRRPSRRGPGRSARPADAGLAARRRPSRSRRPRAQPGHRRTGRGRDQASADPAGAVRAQGPVPATTALMRDGGETAAFG